MRETLKNMAEKQDMGIRLCDFSSKNCWHRLLLNDLRLAVLLYLMDLCGAELLLFEDRLSIVFNVIQQIVHIRSCVDYLWKTELLW